MVCKSSNLNSCARQSKSTVIICEVRFLYAYFVLDNLREYRDLESLRSALDTVSERLLSKTQLIRYGPPSVDVDLKILKWLAYSARSLTLKELTEVIREVNAVHVVTRARPLMTRDLCNGEQLI